METDSAKPLAAVTPDSTAFKILGAIGFSHLLKDMIQSLIPALYPLLHTNRPDYVYQICGYLPLLGLLRVFLPDSRKAALRS
jgi:hypothetical protein